MTDLKQSVPVIIDDVKQYQNFQMTRCVYFTIESDIPSPNWYLGINDKKMPFYLLGLSGIIFKPFGDEEYFKSARDIEEIFDIIESNVSLYIDTNDIWLPNYLFKEHERGQIYRIEGELFVKAYLFRENKISEESFLSFCEEFRERISPSPEETLAFHEWSNQQIGEAKEIYPKNKALELKWE